MKNNKGFSLVELIVVIAIMAILATVAVIGVSVYIPKAQKAADEQMIADVKKAVDLYAGMEELAPNQSGYIVIHKAGNGANGNVTVGGAMSEFLSDALEATFGEKYGTELKVSYQEWTGTLNLDSVENITDSSYYENTDDLLDKIQTLTNALKGFYGDSETAQKDANQATLDVAANTGKYIKNEEFMNWWTGDRGLYNLPSNAFNFEGESDALDPIKTQLAAAYGRAQAVVLYMESMGCAGSRIAFDNASEGFNTVTTAEAAVTEMNVIMTSVAAHINGGNGESACAICGSCIGETGTYFTSGQAETDAKAYLSLLGQIDSMSDIIQGSDEFDSDNLYNSSFITNTVGGYTSAAEAFNNANAADGDIVFVVLVDSVGIVSYKIYPLDY